MLELLEYSTERCCRVTQTLRFLPTRQIFNHYTHQTGGDSLAKETLDAVKNAEQNAAKILENAEHRCAVIRQDAEQKADALRKAHLQQAQAQCDQQKADAQAEAEAFARAAQAETAALAEEIRRQAQKNSEKTVRAILDHIVG